VGAATRPICRGLAERLPARRGEPVRPTRALAVPAVPAGRVEFNNSNLVGVKKLPVTW